MPESPRAWGLSIVLREVQYPAKKWMVQTAADLYGADVRTRIELRNLPEVVYNDIDEVVSAVENHANDFATTPAHPVSQTRVGAAGAEAELT